MTIPDSQDAIYCQNCGRRWEKVGEIAESPMFYFEPKIDVHQYEEVADIVAAEVQMTHCPVCPHPIDDVLFSPREKEENEPGAGSSDVVEQGET